MGYHHSTTTTALNMPDVSTQTAPAHERSEGTVNPALRIFKVPPTDISINA